jgi:hypothetical protein
LSDFSPRNGANSGRFRSTSTVTADVSSADVDVMITAIEKDAEGGDDNG